MDGQLLTVSKRHRVVLAPASPMLSNLFPNAKRLSTDDGNWAVLPHGLQETLLLRHEGFRVPAPIEMHYDWCHTVPFASQKATAALLTTSPRAYVLNELGTGKTRAILFAIDWLLREGLATKALVAAPLSTLGATWEQECLRYFPHLTTALLHGKKQQRQKLLARNDVDIYIINHDGVAVLEADLMERPDIDIVVVDELAVLRNYRTTRWRTFNRVCRNRRWIWGATGAPTPTAPTDAYAQVKLLTPGRVPKYFTRFKEATMTQFGPFTWKPKADAKHVVHEVMQPSVRFTREECIDLPPAMTVEREVQMTKNQQKIYEELSKRLHLLVQQQGSLTAANAGVLMNKLLQVSCGYVYLDSGKTYSIGHPSRLEAVRELIEETERKLLIFVPFRHAVRQVYKELSKDYDVAMVYGDTPRRERDQIFVNFQQLPSPGHIVAHPGCMAHGLTLTAANTIVWYSPTTSNEIYEQANARITRPGQMYHQLIVHLIGSKVERAAYRRLQERQTMQDAILGLYRGVQAA